MGHIKTLFDMKKLPQRSLTPNMIWTDLCENVHLHYRNVRFDFSQIEFARFRAAINHLGQAVEYCADEYGFSEGDPNFLVQQKFDELLPSDSDYYANRATLELQRDDTVHFHYRDLRLHLSPEEFDRIAEMFINSRSANDYKFPEIKEKTVITLPIEAVQPYDEGHRPMVIDEEHRDGIEFCKGLIRSGQKIRPILVATNGQRLDGFKRYMAHLELGETRIECIVDPHGRMGGQHNQSMIADDEKASVNHCSECDAAAFPQTADGILIRWECEACGAWNDNEFRKIKAD